MPTASSDILLQAKAACILLDLCSGLLAPWMAQVVAKVRMGRSLLYKLYAVCFGGGLGVYFICCYFH